MTLFFTFTLLPLLLFIFFFFNDTATTEIYTLSLHDALPISRKATIACAVSTLKLHCLDFAPLHHRRPVSLRGADRKSTRLNSSHVSISYAVFCLKKKKKKKKKQ